MPTQQIQLLKVQGGFIVQGSVPVTVFTNLDDALEFIIEAFTEVAED